MAKKAKAEKALGKDVSADDIYQFEYKRPEYESKGWMNLHGKCIEAGQKKLKEMGYIFLQNGYIPKTDEYRTGTVCNHCGEMLDREHRDRFLKERNERRKREREEYLEMKAIRAEWEAEQILLGKM